ncbi:MAG: hypothetical protein ACOY4Q_08810 [Bacillota bacterium]
MRCVKISYEGKIEFDDLVHSRCLLALLKFLVDDRGYTVQKWDDDEIKLKKDVFQRKHEGDIEIATKDTSVKIEIEVEDNSGEIEVECENPDLVKETVEDLTKFLSECKYKD